MPADPEYHPQQQDLHLHHSQQQQHQQEQYLEGSALEEEDEDRKMDTAPASVQVSDNNTFIIIIQQDGEVITQAK